MILLILSGAYISAEMQCEFGCIPPCMLPLGGKLLLEHQVQAIESSEKYLSLPDDYMLSGHEAEVLKSLKIKVLRVNHEHSLGQSLYEALEKITINDRLNILFGDTLIEPTSTLEGVSIGVSRGLGYYKWAVYDEGSSKFSSNAYERKINDVFNGYLSSPNKETLDAALVDADFNFIDALNNISELKTAHLKRIQNWLDFGHLNTYYESRRNFTTERAFNSLTFQDGFLIKSSRRTGKLSAELNWFHSLPTELKLFTPVVAPVDGGSGYKIEYLNNLTISDIYLFCRGSSLLWKRIISSIFQFYDRCATHFPPSFGNDYDWDHLRKTRDRWNELPRKTRSRLQAILATSNCTIDDLFESIAYSEDEAKSGVLHLIHGDLCFSNMMYDFRSNRVRVIDPRGCDYSDHKCVFGPGVYDIAKIGHSIIGRYDEIVAARYFSDALEQDNKIIFYDEHLNENAEIAFLSCVEERKVNLMLIYKQMIGLFISMLPLHADSEVRQKALFINGLRLRDELLQL